MRKIGILFITMIAFISCDSSDDSSDNGNQNNFDRSGMMTNIADNLIIPAFTDLNNDLATLENEIASFSTSPDLAGLNATRTAWLNAYTTWQYVEMYNIGKAEEVQLAFKMNVYPTNVTDIQNNILDGNADLNAVNNNDAVGFPAVEYMIYGTGNDDQEIIDFYTTDSNASLNKQYLIDLSAAMKSLTQEVLDDWNNGFRDSFVNSTENTATSALNRLVNDYIFYYEKGLRANKIGIPAGIFSSSSLPDRVEGLYSEVYSKQLATTALNAVRQFFTGQHYNSSTTGLSLSDYVTASETDANNSLSTEISNQFETAQNQLSTLDANLSSQVNTNNTAMLQTYDELQRAVVLLKVDMLQLLNINVDYVDADGD
ncbi:imelysin family protein [Nonlabens sp. SY33080]|uniref:imelysin family protein n=1 Tax=Nonlabens sp. SY33080 TaxID=2719911 RepID=UPI001428D829|nr:imelysin family protein [Nonlabens sp. SY33080]